ncbi:MAG: cyanophycin synthetase, partial [Bacteroidota bacterium]
NAFALVNIDDKRGTVMIQNTEAKKHTYAKRNMTDFKVRLLENAISGLHLEINGQEVHSRLIGEFNAYNLTAVYGTAMLLEQDPIEVLTVMSQLKAAEGRFDYIQDDEGKAGIVDYAHTPDALEKILETINELKSPLSKVITVVGCGGDRDRKKRPVMAQIAVAGSDLAILTSDNPRTEDPDFIISEMEAGLNKDQLKQTLTISNRRSAIKTAVKMATSKDIVLVAGKGHEKYQEINGVRHPFDDKAELIAAMS